MSSPRAYDVNGDGRDDLLFGTGVEYYGTDWREKDSGAVIAVDGATQRIVWQAPTQGEIVGSAQFVKQADGTVVAIELGRLDDVDAYHLIVDTAPDEIRAL